MSNTANKGPGPEDSGDPESRLAWRLGHAGPALASALWVVLTVAVLTDISWVGIPASFAIIGGFVLMTRHDYNAVCIRCLREQPDDGGQQVVRKVWYLYVHHLPGIGLYGKIFVAFASCMGWVVATALDSWLGALLTLVTGSWFALDWYAHYVHRRLKPWCPWCRDPGDDPDAVPERDPDPSMTKTA